MTSIPASRSARATIFTPRSWPSKPTLAIKTRSLEVTLFGIGLSFHPAMGYLRWSLQSWASHPILHHSNAPFFLASQAHRFPVFTVNFSQHIADLSNRCLCPHGLEQGRHQTAASPGDPFQTM